MARRRSATDLQEEERVRLLALLQLNEDGLRPTERLWPVLLVMVGYWGVLYWIAVVWGAF